MAALCPFPVLHYEQLGLHGEQIGLLTGIPPALILIGAAVSGDSLLLAHCHQLFAFHYVPLTTFQGY